MRLLIVLSACLISALYGCTDRSREKVPAPPLTYYCALPPNVSCIPYPLVTMGEVFR